MIGVSLGFAVRIVFTAVEFAGEIIGLQMGLNFAGFFNPMTGGQATAVSRFFSVSIGWLFIVINGHLLLIAAVVQSFHAFPVSAEPFAFLRTVQPQIWGAEVFQLGLWIALPMVAMLLFVNLVLGIISRVAQQMNVFAIGFPITVSARPRRRDADAADDADAVHDGARADARVLPVIRRSAAECKIRPRETRAEQCGRLQPGSTRPARCSRARARAAQPSRWSLTRPIACMNA